MAHLLRNVHVDRQHAGALFFREIGESRCLPQCLIGPQINRSQCSEDTPNQLENEMEGLFLENISVQSVS
jgi:hypothetical protein